MARVTNNLQRARLTAQANADFFGFPYAVFSDTSGYIQVERYMKPERYNIEVFYPKIDRMQPEQAA